MKSNNFRKTSCIKTAPTKAAKEELLRGYLQVAQRYLNEAAAKQYFEVKYEKMNQFGKGRLYKTKKSCAEVSTQAWTMANKDAIPGQEEGLGGILSMATGCTLKNYKEVNLVSNVQRHADVLGTLLEAVFKEWYIDWFLDANELAGVKLDDTNAHFDAIMDWAYENGVSAEDFVSSSDVAALSANLKPSKVVMQKANPRAAEKIIEYLTSLGQKHG